MKQIIQYEKEEQQFDKLQMKAKHILDELDVRLAAAPLKEINILNDYKKRIHALKNQLTDNKTTLGYFYSSYMDVPEKEQVRKALDSGAMINVFLRHPIRTSKILFTFFNSEKQIGEKYVALLDDCKTTAKQLSDLISQFETEFGNKSPHSLSRP